MEEIQIVKQEKVRPFSVKVKISPHWASKGLLQEIGEVELTADVLTEDDARKLAVRMAEFAEKVLKEQYDAIARWGVPV